MGYFDGLAASSFKDEGGQYYLIGFGKPRRFRTQDDYEAARESLGTYYAVGLPLIVVLAVAGRQFGYGWTILGAVLLIGWLMIFGRKRLTTNTVVDSGVSDGIGERLDRMAANSGVATLRWLLAGSSAFTLVGLAMLVSAPDNAALWLAVVIFFGACTVMAVVLVMRSGKPASSSTSDLDRLGKLADLRDRGILTEAEFQTQKAQMLSPPAVTTQREREPSASKRWWFLPATVAILLLVGGTYILLTPENEGVVPSLLPSTVTRADGAEPAAEDSSVQALPSDQQPDVASGAAPAESSMFQVTGTCSSVVFAGQEYSSCDPRVMSYTRSDGRVGFTFYASDVAMIDFSGPGAQQRNLTDHSAAQPIDRVTVTLAGMGGAAKPTETTATGACSYEDPFSRKARIECHADTGQGRFGASYVTDGNQPTSVDVDKL